MVVGSTIWAIPEGYIPKDSHGPGPEMESHDSIAVLNAGEQPANIAITFYFTDREPVRPYLVQAPARRSTHIRYNNLTDPEPIPKGTEFSSLVVASQPVVVQYTRLDSRQAENALLSVMAYPVVK